MVLGRYQTKFSLTYKTPDGQVFAFYGDAIRAGFAPESLIERGDWCLANLTDGCGFGKSYSTESEAIEALEKLVARENRESRIVKRMSELMNSGVSLDDAYAQAETEVAP